MSIQAVAWVLEQSDARLSGRLALIVIANHADERGQNSWPSLTRIGREARLSRSQAIRAIDILAKEGYITTEEGAGPEGTNRYAIIGMAEEAKARASRKMLLAKRAGVVANPPNGSRKSADLEGPPPLIPPPVLQPSVLQPSVTTARTLLDAYHAIFTARFGQPPVINGGKDGALMKRLEQQYGRAKVEALLRAFFESEDRWILESGYTVGAFHASVNKLIAQERAPDRFAGLREFVGETG